MRYAWLIGWVAVAGVACDDGGGDGAVTKADAGDQQMGPAGGAGGGAGPLPPPDELPLPIYAPEDRPAATTLAKIPFPNDLYRDGAALDLEGFPRGLAAGFIDAIVRSVESQVTGFATSGNLYLSFETRIDETQLPGDAAATLREDASVFLVDVDPDSSERGRRWPLKFRVFAEETAYLPAHSLAARLVEGIALRPLTTYAFVVTTAAAKAQPDFARTLGEEKPSGALGLAWEVNAPLRDWLAENPGIEPAVASVFTTQDPVGELFVARDYIHTLDRPVALDVESNGVKQNRFELFWGTYQAPRFQKGTPPYRIAEVEGEGGMVFDATGKPVIQGTETMRFALTVPLGNAPEGGWPVALYGHGTGGNYTSFFRADVSAVLAPVDVAVLSIDQIHHGDRNPACPERDPNGQAVSGHDECVQISFFNFVVPAAGRDNVRQSALDFVSLMRFAQGLEIDREMSRQPVKPRDNIQLNPNKIIYMGHSQGGLNGPLFMAIEPEIIGGVLSAAGAALPITIEQKTRPVDINLLVRSAIGLRNEALDRWHPTMALLQTYIEVSDAVNYARFWFAEPPPGFAPKSVFMTAGLEDQYTPPDSIFALAAAGRVPIIEPVLRPIEALTLLGIDTAGIPPYKGNVAGGAASAGVAQYEGQGHFIIQQVPSAKQRYRKFMETLVEGDPRIF